MAEISHLPFRCVGVVLGLFLFGSGNILGAWFLHQSSLSSCCHSGMPLLLPADSCRLRAKFDGSCLLELRECLDISN